MRVIELTKGMFTVVSDSDYERLMQFKWSYDGRYACRYGWNKETKKTIKIYMHHEVLGFKFVKGVDKFVDHIDQDKLNNTRENLRYVTKSQNMTNAVSSKKKSSKYRGVTWFKRHSKWRAYTTKDGQAYHLGYFDSEKEAAIAYNEFAANLHGEYASLNEIED